MKYELPFKHLKSLRFPIKLRKFFAWLIMGFAIFTIAIGIIINNGNNATAQSGNPQTQSEYAQIPQPEQNAPAIDNPQTLASESPNHSARQPNAASTNPHNSQTPSEHNSILDKKIESDHSNFFSRFISIAGIFGFIGIAWLLSEHKKKVLWKLVAVGTAIQLIFALFILWTTPGKLIFSGLNEAVNVLIGFTNAGTKFLFASYMTGEIDPPLVNTAMSILPPIIFFSALMTMLYYFGIMQWIVRGMAVFMMKLMGTSGSESLSSVANIFVGMTEAPLVIKPYVATMTRSELFAIMTGGMATVAGGVMASYVAMLQPFFPDIAGHLIAASVMSAPASLVIAKIMIPETETSETMGKVKLDIPNTDANVIDAIARGAGEGMQLAINVGAMLLAFIAMIALINFILGFPSRLINANTYEHVNAIVVQEGGTPSKNCEKIYSSADTVACTHSALMQLAQLRNITPPQNLASLQNDESENVRRTEELYQLILQKQNDTPNATTLEEKSIFPSLKLETILGWLFYPIAFLMGIPASDCFLVGQLLGEKTAINEFVAYLHFSQIIDKLSYRSIIITSYALCGFANFGSIAILIGGIGGMAPNRRHDIAKLGIKAMIAGTIAAFMTATIAGALI